MMNKIFKFSDNFHGSGPIYFSWQKGSNLKYLVTTGYDQIVNLHDRYGNKIDSFNLTGICSGLEWNKNGDLLAIITEKSSLIKLWDSNNHKVIGIDFAMKESLNLLLWSIRVPNLLAVTTSKGNLLIYDHNSNRKIPILGKHTKKIVSGCWTNQNLLALVCEDRFLTISDDSGDTIFQTNLKAKGSMVKSSPKPIELCTMKNDNQLIIESYCLSITLNRKQIILLPINSLDHPFVLSFEERYNEIFDYFWLTNGLLLIAFTNGYIISVQTAGNQIGRELIYVKVFPNEITGLNICESTGDLAVINKNIIKLLNANSLEQIDNVYTIEDEQELEWIEWSTNGQMLAVSSNVGNLDVFLFLARLPSTNCTYQTKIAYLSSLLEITFIDVNQEKLDSKQRNRIQLDIEPTLISIGGQQLAACINNRAYFYELNSFYDGSMLHYQRSSDDVLMKEKEYSSIVKNMLMNDHYAAILFTDHKAILHRLPQFHDFDRDFHQFEQQNKDYYQVDTKLMIVCIELTNYFFIWCTDAGILELFSIDEWTTVSVHRHTNPIRMIRSDLIGLRLLLIDENGSFVFDSTNEQLIPIEIKKDETNGDNEDNDLSFNYNELSTDRLVVGQRNYNQTFPIQLTKLFWDQIDHSMFVAVDRNQIQIYYYVFKSVQGSFVQLIGKSNLDENLTPLLVHDGFIYYQTPNGTLGFSQLETHNYSKVLLRNKQIANTRTNLDEQEKIFHNLLKLRRTVDCWFMCKAMNRIENWLLFIDCCLHDLNLSEAIRIARYIGHSGIVWSLKSIEKIEEWYLLAGHLAMFLQWFDLAEKLYLKSSQPICALKLRLDLMQWPICLVLAKRLANDQLPFIHKQQANELEFEENYDLALEHYQDGLIERNDRLERDQLNKHNQECLAGISRCLIKCGDSKKALQIAMKLDDLELVHRTAIVFEESNQYNDAAILFERTKKYENACLLYLKTRNLSKVKELLQQHQQNSSNLTDANDDWPTKTLLIQYGKLQEQDGKLMDAYKAYEQANQILDCVRLLLDKMNQPQDAVKLVRQQRMKSSTNQSTDACLLIAKYFQQCNDYESAIEFLVYSGKLDEAFELAIQESQMDLYTTALVEIINSKSNESSSSLEFNLNNFQKYDKNLIKQLERIAMHYEEEHNLLNAGKFYSLANQTRKGIKNLLKAHQIERSSFKHHQNQMNRSTNDEDPLKLAIEFACKSNDEQSIQQVIEVLVSSLENGNQTDFQYLFKLYMCSGQYREATKTALLLAKEEQIDGNYDVAHGLLVEMCKNLLSNKLKLSFELVSALHLLHCYKLAKLYLKFERLEESCELLCKVSNGINKFPKHAAQILSTTIVECLKLNKRVQAIDYSTVLIQNAAYLDQLDAKFRRKIETLIRKSASSKRDKLTDAQQTIDESNCPFCEYTLPKFQLNCDQCRSACPFSILTGHHLTNEECFHCNCCFLPFASKEFIWFQELDCLCPACGSKLDYQTITKLDSLALLS